MSKNYEVLPPDRSAEVLLTRLVLFLLLPRDELEAPVSTALVRT
jgi:hypothetical protein